MMDYTDVSVVLLTNIQLKNETIVRGDSKQYKDEVNGTLLSNGILSCNYAKDGNLAYKLDLSNCESICISKSSNPTVCIEYGRNLYHLVFTKQSIMELWYDKIVETLNALGFEFEMAPDRKLRRKIASQRIVRPKGSHRRRRAVSALANLDGYAEPLPTESENHYAEISTESDKNNAVQCSDYDEPYIDTEINKTVPPPVKAKPNYHNVKKPISEVEYEQYENSQSANGFDILKPLVDTDINMTYSNYLDEKDSYIHFKDLDFDTNTFRKRSNHVLRKSTKAVTQEFKTEDNEINAHALKRQHKQTLTITVNKHDIEGNMVLQMVEGVLFVAWLKRALSILFEGDIINTINNQSIDSVEDAFKIIRKTVKDPIELEIVRLPYAEILTINRTSMDTDLGFKLEKRKVKSVEHGGLAELAGLKTQTMKVRKIGSTTLTCITAINGCPLGQHCTDEEATELLTMYRDVVTLVVQPLDLVACLQHEVDFLC